MHKIELIGGPSDGAVIETEYLGMLLVVLDPAEYLEVVLGASDTTNSAARVRTSHYRVEYPRARKAHYVGPGR